MYSLLNLLLSDLSIAGKSLKFRGCSRPRFIRGLFQENQNRDQKVALDSEETSSAVIMRWCGRPGCMMIYGFLSFISRSGARRLVIFASNSSVERQTK